MDKLLYIRSLPILYQVLPKLPLCSLFSLKTPPPFEVVIEGILGRSYNFIIFLNLPKLTKVILYLGTEGVVTNKKTCLAVGGKEPI